MHSTDISQATADFDTLGGRLVRARDATGMSSTELAKRMGVTTKTIDAWESDRSEPGSNQLNMLSGLHGVSPTWLLFGRGRAPQEEGMRQELQLIRGQLLQLQEMHEKTGQAIVTIEQALYRIDSESA